MMRIKPVLHLVAILLIVTNILTACGGGGGKTPSAKPATYSTTVIGMDLRLQNNNQSIDTGGLPITSSTVSRNP